MEIKVNDYVRTKDGLIRKVVSLDNWVDFVYLDKSYISDEPEYHECFLKEEIIKSSPNIIDLIEVGDYVNGYLVIEKDINNELRYIDLKDRNMKYVKYLDIKSIVTKEQFEQMKYKIN